MAETRTLPSVGPVSLLLKYERSLASTIHGLNTFQRQFTDVWTLRLETDEDFTILHVDIVPSFSVPQVTTLCVALIYMTVTEAIGGGWVPQTVHLPHAQPEQLLSFRRFFDCDVEFSSEVCGLSFPSSDLPRPNSAANLQMAENATTLLALLPVTPASVTNRVRASLALLLPTGSSDLSEVAKSLGVEPRTLQRMLAKENCKYADVVNSVRRNLAQKYLSDEAVPLARVAHQVGFAGQSAFTRWFFTQFGATPGQWRGKISDR
jgi:AraC-like DNA-binding protein